MFVAGMLAGLAGLGAVAPAAAATRVAIVRPAPAGPAVSEALARIEGELAADGFDVVLVDAANAPEDASKGASTEATPDDSGAQASISFSVDMAARTAELRVVDRLTNKAVVRRTPIDETNASRAAEVLAVRAVELLRASLLELMIEAEPPAPATPASAANGTGEADRRQARAWAAKALPERSDALSRGESHEPRWSFEAGAGVLASTGGVGPAVVSVVRSRYRFRTELAVRATLAGLGTAPRVDSAAGRGNATVAQDLGLAEIVATPWPHALVRPVFSLGAGALYTSVDGQAAAPYLPRRASEWSAAADAGAGVEIALGDRFALALEVHALLAFPYPVVRFLDDEAARADDPSIMGTLTLSGSP